MPTAWIAFAKAGRGGAADVFVMRTDRKLHCLVCSPDLESGRHRASEGAPPSRSCGQRRRAVARVLPQPARPAWLEGDQAVSDLQGNRGGGLPRNRRSVRRRRQRRPRRGGVSDCDLPMAALTSTTASASSTSPSRRTRGLRLRRRTPARRHPERRSTSHPRRIATSRATTRSSHSIPTASGSKCSRGRQRRDRSPHSRGYTGRVRHLRR